MTNAESPLPQLTHRQILVILGALLMGMMLAALDQTIVSTALPTIVTELGGLSRLSWVVTAYMLASTISTPVYGKLGDLVGRKVVFQVAIVIFLLGSIASGAAGSMMQLIVSRAVQGLGAGGLIVTAQAIIADIVSPRERGRYQGYVGAVFGASSIVGPLLGGFCTDHLSWRWVFYLNIPLAVAALFVTAAVLPAPPPRAPGAPRPRVDYLGVMLLSCAVSCLVMLTTWGGTVLPWGSGALYGMALGCLVLFAAFVAVERREAEPLIPPALFRDATFRIAAGASFVIGITIFGVVSFIPVFMQVSFGASATGSGLVLVPFMIGLLGASIISGRYISKNGRYKRYPVAGTLIATVGMFLFARMTPDTPRFVATLAMTITGTGLGLTMQVMVVAMQNTVERRYLGVGTSTITFFRSVGGSCGVALFGAIFNVRLARELAGTPFAALLLGGGGGTHGAHGGGIFAALQSMPPADARQVAEAFARALSVPFLVAAPCLLVAFALVLLLEEKPLRGRDAAAAPPPVLAD